MILVEYSFSLPKSKTKINDSHLCKNGFDAIDLGNKLMKVLGLNKIEITWNTSTTVENTIINKPKKKL